MSAERLAGLTRRDPPEAASQEGCLAVYEGEELGSALAVALVVADAEGVSPLELPPLYETIDPDALGAIFRHDTRPDVAVTFPYAGYTVVVRGDDRISLWRADSQTGPAF